VTEARVEQNPAPEPDSPPIRSAQSSAIGRLRSHPATGGLILLTLLVFAGQQGLSPERPFGSARFLFVYFLSGVSGVSFSLAFSPHPSAGASGAIFGLLGAFAGFLYQHRSLLGPAGTGQLRHILLVAVVNLLIGLSPGIDNWGHLGGLLFGLSLSFMLGPRYEVEWREDGRGALTDRRTWSSIGLRTLIAVLATLGLAFLATVAAFLR
jgi:hypothetical protein